MRLSFNYDLTRFVGASQAIQQAFATRTAPMEKGFKRAGAIYLGSMRSRFIKASRGDGTWPDLADSTKAQRRKTGKTKTAKVLRPFGSKSKRKTKVVSTGQYEILRDTGLLFNSLSQGGPQSVFDLQTDGIVVGTAIKYAKYHQNPSVPGRPPIRKILVQPDEVTALAMKAELSKAVAETVRGLING